MYRACADHFIKSSYLRVRIPPHFWPGFPDASSCLSPAGRSVPLEGRCHTCRWSHRESVPQWHVHAVTTEPEKTGAENIFIIRHYIYLCNYIKWSWINLGIPKFLHCMQQKHIFPNHVHRPLFLLPQLLPFHHWPAMMSLPPQESCGVSAHRGSGQIPKFQWRCRMDSLHSKRKGQVCVCSLVL